MFQRTTSVNKLLALSKRKRIIQGGTWAGKTYGIIAVLIDYAAKNTGKNITVVGETIPAVKRGALRFFTEIMQVTGRWYQDRYNATERIYTFGNGSTIEFTSFDSVGKAQAAGKRTDLFINEAPYISFEVAYALMIRTSGNIWIDFNPTHEFWAHTEVMDSDADFIILKYNDNQALPESIKRELLSNIEKAKTSTYWANWCKVYIDGEIGSLDGVIYGNWKQVDKIPSEARLLGIGLDFGYTNDPSAAVAIYKYNEQIIVDEIFYQTEMLNRDIAKALKEFNTDVIADSAEPKSIVELSLLGLKCYPTLKGADSVMNGIQQVQKLDMLITSHSVNLIKELRSYSWDKDNSGKSINKPIDKYNHICDALRYVVTSKLGITKTKIRIR